MDVDGAMESTVDSAPGVSFSKYVLRSVSRRHMRNFWEEHSQNADVTDMTCDSKAAEYSDEEVFEISELLPDLEENAILELGAGIGRFTGVLCDAAKSVVAVDFIQKFIEENKQKNGHRTNLELIRSDALDLSFPEDRFDFIFTNWLFMYLSDAESTSLVNRMLTWLKPGGRLCVRESCYGPVGDTIQGMEAPNPSVYRTPNDYVDIFCNAKKEKNDASSYSFKVMLSKPLETYIKKKNNDNQIFWLLEMTRTSE